MSEREQDAFLGEKTIGRYGCFGCHLIPGFETTPAIGSSSRRKGASMPICSISATCRSSTTRRPGSSRS